MEERIIKNFGLTKNEAKIYLTLLREGSSLAGEITEKTGIHRRNVYDTIERLIEKGLVSYVTVDNKKLFNPANPERFLEIIDEQKETLEKKKKDFKKILPELKFLRKEKKKHDVRFFKGAQGLKTVYEDILRTKKDYVGYGSGEIEDLLKFYFRHYVNKRVKLKIKAKLIYSENDRGKHFTKNPFLKVKFLPDEYSSHTTFRIYSDKVAILLLSKEEPLGIIMKNREITNGYRKYFEIIWKAAKA